MEFKFIYLDAFVRLYVDGYYLAEVPLDGFTFFLNGCLTCIQLFHSIDVYPLSFVFSRCLSHYFLQAFPDFDFPCSFDVHYL